MFYRILGKMLPFLLNSFIQLLHTMNMIPLPNKSRSLIALSLKWLALAAVMLLAPPNVCLPLSWCRCQLHHRFQWSCNRNSLHSVAHRVRHF